MNHAESLPVFVVQKHHASHLHYDFRLELDGVLVSWAIPKGPGMNPQEKHLAIRVQDHPLAYKDFEGVIEKGAYGAGEVIVWDNGTYYWPEMNNREEIMSAVRRGLKTGKLELVLKGKKLKGLFHMVKFRNKQWLLIKGSDRFATDKNILIKSKSVVSGKNIEDIADKKEKIAKPKK